MDQFFEALLLSPGTIVGFIVASVIPAAFKWKPSPLLWLLAALLNVPTCIVLYSAFFQSGSLAHASLNNSNGPVTDQAIVASLLIYFWGTAGLGSGLALWLVGSTGSRYFRNRQMRSDG
jgi:hypothetical protein